MSDDRLTSAQRMRALAMGSGLDRVPIIPMASTYTAARAGLPLKEFYLDPQKCLQVQLDALARHGYDGAPSYGVPEWSGWDFGGDLWFPQEQQDFLPYLSRRAVQDAADVETLRQPEPRLAPAAGRLLAFYRLARAKGIPGVSLPGSSPMGIACSIAGPDLLLRWFYKEPALVHQLLRKATDYLLAVTEMLIEEFGAENCAAFSTYPVEAHAVISPKIFERFSVPYVRELHEKLIAKGIGKWLIHLCGDHTRNLPHWKESIPLAPRTVFSVGHEMDLAATAAFFGSDHIVAGNIPTTTLLLGSAAEIHALCRETLEKMKHHPGGFILAPACVLPTRTPPENVQAMVEAAKTFGSYHN